MPVGVSVVLGVIATIAAMIYIYVVVMKEEKYAELPPFCQKLNDLFNFKKLWLESILKFFYILSTVFCVIMGVLLLISVEKGYYGDTSLFLPGLLVLLVGPITIRLTYEATMMFIILVKNVIQINNRLAGKEEKVAEEPVKEIPKEEVEAE